MKVVSHGSLGPGSWHKRIILVMIAIHSLLKYNMDDQLPIIMMGETENKKMIIIMQDTMIKSCRSKYERIFFFLLFFQRKIMLEDDERKQ